MFAYVVFPVSAPALYAYRVPGDLAARVRPGARVFAEFGRKSQWGYVFRVSEEADRKDLKAIAGVGPEAHFFSSPYVQFLAWLSDYYLAAPGEVLRSAFSKDFERRLGREIEAPALVEPAALPPPETLQQAQAAAVAAVEAALAKGEHRTFLLQGVTGSGKTHVYLALARRAFESGKSVLVLVPEIALTPQAVARFTRVFGGEVAVIHSGLTASARAANLVDVLLGRRRIVVGVRSAVFAPLAKLGLIIIDEEHDASYGQSERGFNFNARDAAVYRGKVEGAAVILGSATPSLESRHNAAAGKYERLLLAERYNRRPLPHVHLVDLREERRKGNWTLFSGLLLEKIGDRLAKGEQVILLKNRRGFANFLQCKACGFIPRCPHCEVSLTFHRSIGRLVCHYCDHRDKPPEACPSCRGTDLRFAGAGVERVEEELHKLFPSVRTLRLDLDTASKKRKAGQILDQFQARQADVLVGTQMVSKGLDFANVTLVGVVLADTGLNLPDFHAAERTFQLLTQVAGRSGRGEAEGEVVLQTYAPDEAPIRFAVTQDYEGFYHGELEERKAFGFPPFSRGVLLRFLSKNAALAEEACRNFHGRLARLLKPLDCLGPAPSPVYKVRDRYRHFLYIKTASIYDVSRAIKKLLPEFRAARKIDIQVVVHPGSLL